MYHGVYEGTAATAQRKKILILGSPITAIGRRMRGNLGTFQRVRLFRIIWAGRALWRMDIDFFTRLRFPSALT